MLFTVHKTIKNTCGFFTVFRNECHLIIAVNVYLILHNKFQNNYLMDIYYICIIK